MNSSRRTQTDLSNSTKKQGILLVLVTMLLFAAHDVTSKYLTRYYPVSELLWVRYLTHVLFMLTVFGPRMRMVLVQTSRPFLQILRAMLLVSISFSFMYGLRYIPVAEATAIVYLYPLLVTALSVPLLGERVPRNNWLVVALGFLGVLIIVRPGGAALHIAALCPFYTAIGNSLYLIITRIFKESESPVTTHFITGLVGVFATSFAWQANWIMPAWHHAILMVCLGLFAGFGHYLLIEAFRRVGPAVAAPYTYTQLMWVVLFSFLAFGQIPDAISFIGILIITGCGLYLALKQRQKHAGPVNNSEDEKNSENSGTR